MKKNLLTRYYLFAFILISLPAVASAAITYTRSPSGASVASPVTVTVSVDRFEDFGFSPEKNRWQILLDDIYNPQSACFPSTQLSATIVFNLPVDDVARGVQAVGYRDECYNNDEPYDLEGNGTGVIFRVGNIQGVAATPPTSPTPSVDTTSAPLYSATKPEWGRDLSLGATGNDVLTLQVWLNAHGYVIAASGPGSPGMESNYFGSLTRAAVARFQQAKGVLPAVGYFGPKTRSVISKM